MATVERSLTNLDTDAYDRRQLHCPPGEVYRMPDVFGVLDDGAAVGQAGTTA